MEYLKDRPEYEAFLRGIYHNVQSLETFGYWTKKGISRPEFNDIYIRRMLVCRIQDLAQDIRQGSRDKIMV